ncbi:PEP-utilizing enzyme [Aureococcus anophagefferens]|nr:PEP-utilizing enzyme [Aureococcus anophagefferens]
MAVVLQRQIADALGRGADVEFAVEASKRFGGRKLWLLQARAVTATMDGPASVGPWRGANDGTWERDAHATRPVPPMNDFFGDVLADEVTRAQIKYGLGLAKLRCDLVNGIPYLQPVPLGAPDPPPVGPPPPGPVLAALSRLHPALRKNDRVARRTLKCRGWMADIRAWKDTERAAREAAARALGAVDPKQLGDGDLAEHVETVAVEMAKAWASHQRYTAPCLLTTAAVFARRDFWDHSPDRPLYEAFSACPEALKALGWARKVVRSKSDSAAAIYLGEVVDAASPVREAAAEYLAAVSDRVVGAYDVAAPALRESPAALFDLFHAAATTPPPEVATAAATEAADAAVAARAKPEHRKLVGELLADCREAYRVRDERALFNDAWLNGVGRRALLEVGARRFVDAARAALAAEAGRAAEARSRPRSRPEKLLHWEHRCKGRADRARAFNQMLDSPAVINGPRHPPPQLGKWFPKGGCGELTDAFLAVINVALMGSDCEDEFAAGNLAPGAAVLRGMPASSGAEGALRARVRVVDEATFPELRRGEVAVLNFTNSSFNAYLNRCGAVVTNTGGALSHAICARRRSPRSAAARTRRTLATGDVVEVDGAQGTVTILKRAADA